LEGDHGRGGQAIWRHLPETTLGRSQVHPHARREVIWGSRDERDSSRPRFSSAGRRAREGLRERLGDGRARALPDRDAHALASQGDPVVPPIGLRPTSCFRAGRWIGCRAAGRRSHALFVLDDATGRLVPRSGRGLRRDDMEKLGARAGEGARSGRYSPRSGADLERAADDRPRSVVERFPCARASRCRCGPRARRPAFSSQPTGSRRAVHHHRRAPALVIADRVGSRSVTEDCSSAGASPRAPAGVRGLVDANLPPRAAPRSWPVPPTRVPAGRRAWGPRATRLRPGSGDVPRGAGMLASVGSSGSGRTTTG